MVQRGKKAKEFMPRTFPAFSLIEIAIVLIIMGLVSGMAFPMLKGMLDCQKATITDQNQEKILYALANYAAQNQALPCAANPENLSGEQESARRRGIVPYATLGLPESIAKDGYCRWFTYVVDDYYTTLLISSSQRPTNKLCEKKTSPYPLKIKGKQADIAVILISHGLQGRGAYPDPSAAPPQGQDEIQNSRSDDEIIDRPLSQDPLNPFSHKVIWVTAQNLLATYAHAPCPPVQNLPVSRSAQYDSLYDPLSDSKKPNTNEKKTGIVFERGSGK